MFKKQHAETRRFCSVVCKVEASKGRKARQPAAPPLPRECKRCGTTFTPVVLGSARVYCSRSCATAAYGSRKRVHVEPRECEHCGVEFTPRQKSSVGRFCSKECRLTAMRGAASANFKGGRHVKDSGYVSVLVDGRYVLEHRLVMEQVIGRTLVDGENVHHVNGIKSDNRPENLELWVTSQPNGHRVEDAVEHAVWVLQRYAPHMLAAHGIEAPLLPEDAA